MKKLYYLILVSTILFSCNTTEEYTCESKTALATLKSIYKETLMNSRQVNRTGVTENFIDEFFKDNLRFSMIRTSDINKEIKKCECEAKIIFDVENEFTYTPYNQRDYILFLMEATEIEAALYHGRESIKKEILNGIDIAYTVQETSNNEIIVETFEIEKMKEIIVYYYFKYKQESQNSSPFNPNNPKKDTVFNYVAGTGDCGYDIWFILSPRDNGVKGAYTQNCIDDMGVGEKKFIGEFINGIIYANIEDKEFFELEFNGEEMNYYLTKFIHDDGDITNYDRANPLTFYIASD